MKYAKLAALLALPVAFALTLGAVPQPAEAAKACNKLNLNSPCIRSGDMKPNLKLGKTGNDGDLKVRDMNKVNSVEIDGDSSTVTNTLTGNGLVKAWAQIAADGSIIDCWRCNTDTAETRKVLNGIYNVDFTPLSTDISGRPYSALLNVAAALATPGQIGAENLSTDVSSVIVTTRDSGGALSDQAYTVIVY